MHQFFTTLEQIGNSLPVELRVSSYSRQFSQFIKGFKPQMYTINNLAEKYMQPESSYVFFQVQNVAKQITKNTWAKTATMGKNMEV